MSEQFLDLLSAHQLVRVVAQHLGQVCGDDRCSVHHGQPGSLRAPAIAGNTHKAAS